MTRAQDYNKKINFFLDNYYGVYHTDADLTKVQDVIKKHRQKSGENRYKLNCVILRRQITSETLFIRHQ